jgi:hypothetical protein
MTIEREIERSIFKTESKRTMTCIIFFGNEFDPIAPFVQFGFLRIKFADAISLTGDV